MPGFCLEMGSWTLVTGGNGGGEKGRGEGGLTEACMCGADIVAEWPID